MSDTRAPADVPAMPPPMTMKSQVMCEACHGARGVGKRRPRGCAAFGAAP
jgi:hypothetical protein